MARLSASSSCTPALFKCEETISKGQESTSMAALPCACMSTSTSTPASSSKESWNMMINSHEQDENSDQDIVAINGCSTPKARRFRIPDISSSSCPPAPKKRRVTSSYVSNRSPIAFYAPPDIELFFFLAFQNIPAGVALQKI
ncbi:cyclin-dependent protein kinase inhibitor SMR9-like [Juglans regia]|uniref:Cyclin-dependent protein kinase inhibitor SMR9-like n=1 Tax=Juglans regia TaxID=51240 RepID=A0A6P9ELP9_JUGRE|nr:cyclin-dependent protein kinase inhibitor SMR9-like [Juglans regia]